MKKEVTTILIAGFAILTACKQSLDEESTKDYSLKGDTITVYKDTPLAEKITTMKVNEEAYQSRLRTTGLVKAIPTQVAQIAAPFSGRAVQSYISIGQKVSKGAPLFEISSAEFIDIQKAFFQTKSEYNLANQNLERQKDLIENGVGTKKDLEEAQNQYEIANQEYNNAAQSIRIYGVNPNEMILGQNLTIRSPISGEIIENKLVVGQFLKEDADPIATIAELSTVWIIAQVKEKDIRNIHKNDEVEIQVTAYPDLPLKGKVFHIRDRISDESRALDVLIESTNPNLILKQGMFVNIQFKSQANNKIVLPTKALLQDEDDAFVYIQSADNTYTKRRVEVGDSNGDHVVIEKGLKTNERVVSEGGYYLLNAH